jgi:hypothetical protein
MSLVCLARSPRLAAAAAPAPTPVCRVGAALAAQVLFNIADSYIRRAEGQDRVIGTLLGRRAGAPRL